MCVGMRVSGICLSHVRKTYLSKLNLIKTEKISYSYLVHIHTYLFIKEATAFNILFRRVKGIKKYMYVCVHS